MQTKERKQIEKSLGVYMAFIVLIVIIFLVRLAWLQVIDTESYQLQAQKNKIRQTSIDAARGNIISADGVVLATDQPTFQVMVNAQTIADMKKDEAAEVFRRLANILNDPELSAETIEQKVDANSSRMYEPIVVKKGLDIATVSTIEARRDDLPGVYITSSPSRTYPQGDLAGHVLGYIGEVSQEELDAQAAQEAETGMAAENRYAMGDYIGKNGLEKSYDDVLRGEKGSMQVEVDAKNHPLTETTVVPPVVGDDLILTLDYRLQKQLEESFDNMIAKLQKDPRSDKAGAGAAVVLDVKTGAVLAMTSRPADKITQQNRAIQGRYIPGSTFKMVTLTAALETGNITPTETITNPGRYWIDPFIKSTAPPGKYNLYTAMAKSDNVFFQEIGRRTTREFIAKYGQELGLEYKTGIDLPYESSGERATDGLPTQEKLDQYNEWYTKNWTARYEKWIDESNAEYDAKIAAAATAEEKEKLEKEKARAEKQLRRDLDRNITNNTMWRPADTFNISMGQGRQNYTPLQLAVYVSTIANGGTVYEPYVVAEIRDSNGNIIQTHEPVVKHQADIDPETLKIVRDAMCKVTEPGGTAYSLFMNFPKEIKVGAKTGTSQPGGAGYKIGKKQYFDGVFVAFAPADDPQIAFVSVMEYGYSGSGSGGVVCKEVFEKYFGLR